MAIEKHIEKHIDHNYFRIIKTNLKKLWYETLNLIVSVRAFTVMYESWLVPSYKRSIEYNHKKRETKLKTNYWGKIV